MWGQHVAYNDYTLNRNERCCSAALQAHPWKLTEPCADCDPLPIQTDDVSANLFSTSALHQLASLFQCPPLAM